MNIVKFRRKDLNVIDGEVRTCMVEVHIDKFTAITSPSVWELALATMPPEVGKWRTLSLEVIGYVTE